MNGESFKNSLASRGGFYDFEKEDALFRFRKAVATLALWAITGFLAGALLFHSIGMQNCLQASEFLFNLLGPSATAFGVKLFFISMLGAMCLSPCVKREKIVRLRPWVCLILLLVFCVPLIAP